MDGILPVLTFTQTQNCCFMAKTIELTVPEPCHESWNDMTPTEKGRFCASCQKDVVDFTNMGQAELVAFFRKKTSGNVCGRFYEDQLNNPMPVPVKRIPWARYFFQITLPAFIASGKLMAQGKVVSEFKKNETDITVLAGFAMVKEKTASPKQIIMVKGQVTDETGNGIPYASIINKKTKAGLATDSLGYFILKDVHLPEGSEYTVSAVGYTNTTFFASRINENKNLQVPLVANNTLEEIVLTIPLTIRCSRTSSGVVMINSKNLTEDIKPFPVQSLATSLEERGPSLKNVTIYPNPVELNRSLNIQLNIESAGKYQYHILAIDGKLVHSGIKDFIAGANNFNLPIDNRFTPGTYIIQIQDEKGKETLNSKFIVQR